MSTIKISNHQITTLTFGFVCGYTSITTSSFIVSFAKQDAWVSVILSTLVGFFIILLQTYLGKIYYDKTYIEIIRIVLGKWIGGFISINFIFISFIGTAQIVWYIGDFFTTEFMPETPVYTINLLFVASMVIALLYGIEAIARAFELFYYIIIPIFIISMVMLLPNIKIDNLMPVFENGIGSVLKGSIPLLIFAVLPMIFLNMIYPINVNDIKMAKKAIFKGYFLGMSFIFILTLMCCLVLGSVITANSRFAAFLLITDINIGIIFTRMEALIVVMWLLTIFNSAIFYFYTLVVGISKILKLKDHTKIIIPLGFIVLIFSEFIYTNVPYEINWDYFVWLPYILTFGLILPIILIVVYFIKKIFIK